MITERLVTATNAHDIEALVACFSPDYQLEMPAHPSRGFRGNEQVRKNWTQFFAAMPDIRCTIVRLTKDGDEEWSEWEMRGTRRDGALFHMRGVIIFTTRDDVITSARFYLEPVDA